PPPVPPLAPPPNPRPPFRAPHPAPPPPPPSPGGPPSPRFPHTHAPHRRSHKGVPMSRSAPSRLPFFLRPFPELPEKWPSPLAQDRLLAEYLDHRGSFFAFAADRGMTVDQLYDWLHSETITDRLKHLDDL